MSAPKTDMPAELRLTIELIPKPLWETNLRTQIGRAGWDRIRHAAYADSGNRCAICGAEGRLECHERWEYDDAAHVQKLVGFLALCVQCHQVKHFGRSVMVAKEGRLDLEAVMLHFMTVNGCDRAALVAHRKAKGSQWKERSEHQWTLDLGVYGTLVAG
jgi:hypothetical protein